MIVTCSDIVDQFASAAKHFGDPLITGALHRQWLRNLWEPTLSALT